MQPCTSLEHFLHSLDQYQNPPKRQRGEQRAVRIQLPNLESFLEINKEWLPLAKAQAAAREKFGELADAQKTRSKKLLQKRLREESIPDLPPDMLQQILNVVPYETPKELVSDFANTFEIASPWPKMALKALCEKINREKIPIIDLNFSKWFIASQFVVESGPYLQYLNLKHFFLYDETIKRIFASCVNLTFLNLELDDKISRDTDLKLPPHLEELRLDTHSLDNLVLPSNSNLKILDISGQSLIQFTLNAQPNLTTCNLRSHRLTVCDFLHLPIIKELIVCLPSVKILKVDHLHSLQKLKMIGVWNLQHFTIPEELLELEILGGLNFHELDLTGENLKTLIITSGEIRRLSLGYFPNLFKIDFQGDGLQELQFNESYSKLEQLIIKSQSIEELVLPHFEALKFVKITCPWLTALNFSAIAHSQELDLRAEKLSLNAVIDPERYKSLNISARDFEIRDPF